MVLLRDLPARGYVAAHIGSVAGMRGGCGVGSRGERAVKPVVFAAAPVRFVYSDAGRGVEVSG